MEEFLNVLKKQAAFFLLELEQFEPFGAYIGAKGEIINIKRQSEFNSIEESYELLLQRFKDGFDNNLFGASAIVLNGVADGKNMVIVEIFVPNLEKYQAVFPYMINSDIVTFGEDANKEYNKVLGNMIKERGFADLAAE